MNFLNIFLNFLLKNPDVTHRRMQFSTMDWNIKFGVRFSLFFFFFFASSKKKNNNLPNQHLPDWNIRLEVVDVPALAVPTCSLDIGSRYAKPIVRDVAASPSGSGFVKSRGIYVRVNVVFGSQP